MSAATSQARGPLRRDEVVLDDQQEIERSTHDEQAACLVFTPRNAVYDHAHRLVKLLRELGLALSVELQDEAFRQFEAIAR